MLRRFIFAFLALLALMLSIHRPVSAQDATASLLIQTVNELRAARGLVAYAGDLVYYTLDVSGSSQVALPAQPPANSQPVVPAQIGAFPTATPQADGSIVHVVQDGDNLATIAETYGVSMEAIRALNGKAPTSNLIFPGEALLIKTAPPPTETPTITPTIPRPTRTPTPFRPTRTPAPTRTASLTPQPTPTANPLVAGTDAFMENNRRLLLLGMGGLCVVGLGWVLWAGFLRREKPEKGAR